MFNIKNLVFKVALIRLIVTLLRIIISISSILRLLIILVLVFINILSSTLIRHIFYSFINSKKY